jgi:hypothetical protein
MERQQVFSYTRKNREKNRISAVKGDYYAKWVGNTVKIEWRPFNGCYLVIALKNGNVTYRRVPEASLDGMRYAAVLGLKWTYYYIQDFKNGYPIRAEVPRLGVNGRYKLPKKVVGKIWYRRMPDGRMVGLPKPEKFNPWM